MIADDDQAWPNDGNNKAPKPGRSVSVEDGDNAYLNWLGGKTYMARTDIPGSRCYTNGH